MYVTQPGLASSLVRVRARARVRVRVRVRVRGRARVRVRVYHQLTLLTSCYYAA